MAKTKGKGSRIARTSEMASMLKAVADPDRLKILHSLRAGPKNVGQLSKILRQKIVNVSHHLGVLRKCKIVHFEKKGRFVHYALNPDVYLSPIGGGETIDLGRCRLELGD
jgi:DNA-binding transcriptional ArsR family regulator